MTGLPVVEFGFPGALRDALVAAVVDGSKTATSALWAEFERSGEPLPEVGGRRQVVDSQGAPVVVIETTRVQVVRLAEVDLSHALDEGEGYLSVAQWRSAHERFWRTAELQAELGGDFVVDDETLVVLERFVVLEG